MHTLCRNHTPVLKGLFMNLKKIARYLYYDLPRKIHSPLIFPCRNFVFEVTYHCNLNCTMCSFLQEIRLKKDEIVARNEMDKDEIISIIKHIPKRSNLAFTGGEPFTKKGFLDILLCAKQRGHAVTIGTNGVHLTEETCNTLVDLKIEQIGLSLDGPREIHNAIRQREIAYDGVIAAIANLRKSRENRNASYPRIMVNAVVQLQNYRVLPQIVSIIHQSGADAASFEALDGSFERSASRLHNSLPLPVSTLGNVPEIDPTSLRTSLEKAMEIAKKIGIPLVFSPQGMTIDAIVEFYQHKINLEDWRCSIPFETCRVSPFGDIYPCMNYQIGSVKENSLYALWNSRRYRNFRSLFPNNKIRPFCIGCCKMTKLPSQTLREEIQSS
jgi:radical SAM protein with 4Fe4S-binding SPASM domain